MFIRAVIADNEVMLNIKETVIKLPVKWMALESLHDCLFSADVVRLHFMQLTATQLQSSQRTCGGILGT